MPLPDNGATWPPPQMADTLAEIRLDDAWYSGDKARLGRAYHAETRQSSRWRLWGRRREQGTPRDHRLHVPLPGDIARTSADLLFAEMPAITCATTATQERLTTLVNESGLAQTLLSGAEQASGLSGIYLRTTWDRELVADRPLFTVVQPDAVVPEWRFGMLRAATIWEELPGSTSHTVLRHLERHESGRVLHGLYEGTADNLGRAVPLTSHEATRGLAADLVSDGDQQYIETGITDLTISYVPNMRPNRKRRGSPMGRSDYAAPIYDQFETLDLTWTSWVRDIRLARSRLLVPAQYLQTRGPGEGAQFDEDREVFSTLNMPPNDSGSGITIAQFAIRFEEHRATAEATVRQAVQSAGYSPESFGLDGGAVMTATEVDDNKKLSMITRKKKAGYWTDPLAQQLHVWLQLDAAMFGSKVTPERPTVAFGSGVAESPERTAATLDMLHRAAAISTETKVRMLHPKWENADVLAETARILAETGAGAPPGDPGTFPM